jgi:hypothetical protein
MNNSAQSQSRGIFLMGQGFELRALCLQGRYCTTLAIPQSTFALVILEMGSYELFPLAGLEELFSQFQSLK